MPHIEPMPRRVLFAALPGDANLDGFVDSNDFAIVAANFNGTGKAWSSGDFTGDGACDLADFTVLATHFGQTATQAKPGPDNTGPRVPTLTSRAGGVIGDGTFERVAFTSPVDEHGHATFTDCTFTAAGASTYAANSEEDFGASATFDHCRFDGTGTVAAVVNGAAFDLEWCDVRNAGSDGINPKVGNCTIAHSWIHDAGHIGSSHADGIQIRAGSHYRIVGNNIDIPKNAGTQSNSAVFLKCDSGPISDVIVDGNFLNGGNYTVYSFSVGSALATDIHFTGNRFGRDYQYGVRSFSGSTPEWAGNVWDDTGATIN